MDQGGGCQGDHGKLCASPGNDIMDGGCGDDHINGGRGHDDLNGGRDRDTIVGGSGHNHLNGGRGNDTYIIAEGSDNIINDSKGYDTIKLEGSRSSYDREWVGDDLVITSHDGETNVTIKDHYAGSSVENIE